MKFPRRSYEVPKRFPYVPSHFPMSSYCVSACFECICRSGQFVFPNSLFRLVGPTTCVQRVKKSQPYRRPSCSSLSQSQNQTLWRRMRTLPLLGGVFCGGMISTSGVATRSLLTFGGVPLREFIAPLHFTSAIHFKTRVQLQHTVPSGRVLVASSMSDGAQSAASGSGSKAVNVVIKGTVQGVFYRKWTVSTAQKLGLNGWVRNCRDGSVEAVFQGPSSTVDTMVQQCGSGPSAARVTVVDVSHWDNEVPQGFEQKRTW